MKHCLLALLTLFACHFSFAQEAADSDSTKSALTFQTFPYNFDSSNPLKPDSEVLLQFNVPVAPDAVPRSVQFWDNENNRATAIEAKRPEVAEVLRLKRSKESDIPLEKFVMVRPASPLPLGGTWYLNAQAGLTSTDGSHEIVESRLDYVGGLYSFQVEDIHAQTSYDTPLRVIVHHNKAKLADAFDDAKLEEYISVSPKPENFSVDSQSNRFVVNGDFQYGTDYKVTVSDGIVARDTTQLAQVVTETVQFEPNDGFISFPAYTATQNASGHRKFDIRTGNLGGVRTRVKHLEGDDLIRAMVEYNEKYEGWGEKQTLPLTMIPGKIVHDDFRESTAEIDHTETVSLDWDELTDNATTGAFYICSEGSSATPKKRDVGAQSLVQLTDIGLVWKQSNDGTMIHAFSLRSGKALAGLTLRLRDSAAATLAETVTDADGIARIAGETYLKNEESLFLDASQGNDRHVLRFSEYLNKLGLWSFSIDQRWDELIDGERRTLVFTDRNVYRPGDEVKLKLISRFIDEDKLLGPGTGVATLRIFDAQHRKLIERSIEFGANGSFDDAFRLPPAGLGWHSIEVDFNPQVDGQDPDWRLIANHSFQVEEYRVNTFEVSVAAEKGYTLGAPLTIPVSARYYMGKPLSKAEMNWNAYAYSSYPRPRGFDEFSFGDLVADMDNFSENGKSALTSQGEAAIEFELPDQGASPSPRQVSVTAQVTDANQQTISNSARFTVHSSDFYLGLRKPEGVHRAGDISTFSLAAVTTDGKAHTAPVDMTILVEKEIWNTVKVMGANGKMTHRNERNLRTVSEETLSLETKIDPATGLTRAMPHDLSFPEAGDFIITATTRDDENRPVITRIKFTVIGAEEPSWSWHDVIRIDLIPDKSTYQIGDTAKLLVRSPVFGNALLTTERGGVRSTSSLMIDQYETVLEIPIVEGDAPNLFASVMIIRGSDDSPHIHKSADYRLGYCQLDIEDPSTKLTLEIESGEAEYYQPGEQVEVTATVVNFEGAGVEGAEVTLWAVDEGVLSLTDHQTPDPHDLFHEAFSLAVSTGQSLGDLLPENPLEQDFMNKGYVIGGGGAGNGLDPDRVRKDFKALAFWQPTLTTNIEGKVTATFAAPDNLTTFRIMAVVAEGNRFGHAESPVVVNKPLIIEPALPGFTNLTDQIDLSAVLHNNTGKAQEVEVDVSLDDHAIFLGQIGEKIPTSLSNDTSKKNRTVKAILEAGATETLAFPVALTQTGEAKWNWKVRSITEPRLRDATESTLMVGYPLPLLRESHTFTLRNGDDLENALAEVAPRLLAGRGDIEMTLSNSRLIEAADALDYLLTYPYGCVEQTTSSLIPWLSTQTLRKVMPSLEKTDAELHAVVEKGIARLLSMQTGDGGLGYWPGATQSMLWGSAYGGMAIALAEKQGVEIPEEQKKALWDYLSLNLRNAAEMKNAYELSQRCLSSYTLALAGVNESSYHEILWEKRGELSGEARALLALAMVEAGTDTPERIDTLLSPNQAVPVAEVSWYRQPYVAATRLLAQVRHDPDSKKVDTLVDDLMKLRQPQRGWGNTYSNAWPLIALSAYGEAAARSMSPNEIAIGFGDRKESFTLPAEPESEAVAFSFDGDVKSQALTVEPGASGPVYASLQIATRPELIPMEAEQNGFTIRRSYEKVEADGSISTAEDLRVGDLVLITLDLNLPNERESYLAIDDPLPAIFEAVNPNFKSQATQKVNKERKARTLYTNHRELRKDRVLFFADSLFGAGDYSIQYLARVVAPGVATAPPAKIEAMYEPQRFGLSGTESVSAAARDIKSGKIASR